MHSKGGPPLTDEDCHAPTERGAVAPEAGALSNGTEPAAALAYLLHALCLAAAVGLLHDNAVPPVSVQQAESVLCLALLQ